MRFKKRNFSALIGFAIILVLGPMVYFGLINPRKSIAAWFDDKWGYRKAVQISNSSGSNLTDFQVSIGIGTSALISSGKMKSDCGDIRITDTNGKLLNHWIEKNTNNSCNKTSTLIWVKVPSIPTSGGTAYVYYGNPSATNTENGKSTFPDYFEDFSGFSDGTDVTSVSSNWSKDVDYSSTFTIDSNRLKMIHPGTAPNEARDGAIYTFPNEITTNFAVDADVTVADSNSYDFMMIVADSGWTGMASSHTYSALWSVIINEDWQGWSGSWSSAQSGLTVGNIYHLGATFDISGDLAKMYVDGTYKIDRTFPDTGTTGLKKIAFGNYGYSSLDSTWYVDNIRVRKSASTDPTSSLSSTEEQSKAPVAYWKFDEGQGQTANDSSSNNINLPITGATWKSEDQCISGKCLYFDGSGDYLRSTDTKVTTIASGASATYSVWFRTGDTTTGTYYPNLMGIRYTGTPYDIFNLRLYQNRLEAEIYEGGSNINIKWSTSVIDNKWHYAALVKNGNNTYLYIDGVLRANSSGSWGEISNSQFIVGAHSTSSGFFNGFLDEVKIYPYARTAAQIKTDYNAGKAHAAAAKGVAVQLGSSNKSSDAFSNGLVGYWKMDEASWSGSAGEVIDSSGNGNHGVGVGTTKPTTGAGKFGNGGVFDGISQYVDAGSNSSLAIPNTITISTWVNPSDVSVCTGATKCDIVARNNAANYLLEAESSGYRFALNADWGNADLRNVGGAPSINTWTHVVATYDGTTMKIYLNGTLAGSKNIATTINTSSGSFMIGRGSGTTYLFKGKLDETRVYNRALSPAEVRQLYEWAPGPVGYWDFENTSIGSSVPDVSGYGNNGGWNGTSTTRWVTGKYGKAGNFNGTSDYVNVADANSLDVNNFTVSFWIKFNSASGNQRLISKGGVSNASNFYLWRNDGNTLVYYGFGKGASKDENSFNPNFTIGQWYKVDLLYNGSAVQVYINGIYKSQMSTTATPNTNASTLEIGYSTISGGNYFNGQIDEVKIYNYARTQKQIVEDMNAGHPAGGSPVGSQIEYWKFDGNLNSSLQNGSTATTLDNVAAKYTNDGKFGKALDFTRLVTGSFTWVDTHTLRDSTKSWATNQWAGYQFSMAWTGSQYCQDTIDSNTATDIVFSSTCNSFGSTLEYDIKKNLYVIAPMPGESTSQVAVSLWFKSNGAPTAQKSIVRAQNDSVALAVNTNSLQSWVLSYTNTITYLKNPHDNNWHYFATTWDGVTQKMYYDGVLVASGALTGTIPSSSRNLHISARNDFGWGGNFNGLVDEVKVYSYALTEDEINLDYNRGAALVLGSLSSGTGNTAPSGSAGQEYCIPGDTSTCSPPVGRWDFNEGVGSSAFDTSGNGNNGGFGTGTAAPTWTKGKIGKSVSFDGVNDTISAGTNSSFEITDEMTFEFWMKPKTLLTDYGAPLSRGGFAAKGYNFDLGTIGYNQIYSRFASDSGWSGEFAPRIPYTPNQ